MNVQEYVGIKTLIEKAEQDFGIVTQFAQQGQAVYLIVNGQGPFTSFEPLAYAYDKAAKDAQGRDLSEIKESETVPATVE